MSNHLVVNVKLLLLKPGYGSARVFLYLMMWFSLSYEPVSPVFDIPEISVRM